MGEKEKMCVEVKKGKCKLRRRAGGGVEEVAFRRSELKNSTQGGRQLKKWYRRKKGEGGSEAGDA